MIAGAFKVVAGLLALVVVVALAPVLFWLRTPSDPSGEMVVDLEDLGPDDPGVDVDDLS